ncbi:MAG: hypothetical protein ACOZCO_14510 [Bacteroidota bacterium]
MENTESKQVFRSAIFTFLGCASLVFIVGFVYCISTNHWLGLTLLGGAGLLVSGIAAWAIKSEK